MAKAVTSLSNKQHLQFRLKAREVYETNMQRYLALKAIPEKKRAAGHNALVDRLKDYFAHYNRNPQVRATSKDEDPSPAGILNYLWSLVVNRRDSYYIGQSK